MNREQFQSMMFHLKNSRSQEAAGQLVAQYEEFLTHVVRQRMNRQIRRRFDSQDFTQQVWASFFRRYPEMDGDFEESDNLKRFLRVLAKNKVIDQTRRNLKTKANKDIRELSLPSLSDDPDAMRGHDPTASQCAQANEVWNQILDRVNDQPGHYRRVVELRCEGLNNDEIAEQVGINEKTVRRILRMLDRLMQPKSDEIGTLT